MGKPLAVPSSLPGGHLTSTAWRRRRAPSQWPSCPCLPVTWGGPTADDANILHDLTYQKPRPDGGKKQCMYTHMHVVGHAGLLSSTVRKGSKSPSASRSRKAYRYGYGYECSWNCEVW